MQGHGAHQRCGAAEEWDERIEQGSEPHYYVPTICVGAEKLYETHPGDECETIKAEVKKALDAVV